MAPLVIAFPAATALIAALCTALVGGTPLETTQPGAGELVRRIHPLYGCRPCEVVGAANGLDADPGAGLLPRWRRSRRWGARAGELYLLLPRRMPSITPGVSLLIVAVAATAVWSAPIDSAQLPAVGWRALERGPFLVALAATINAGGTIVLAGGALYSAWKLRAAGGSGRRAAGCVLIAVGTVAFALGGTPDPVRRPEYLYLSMALGIAIIFAGVVLTRQPRSVPTMTRHGANTWRERTPVAGRG